MYKAKEKKLIANDRAYRLEEFMLGDKTFKLLTVKKRADKRTVIHCSPNGDVQWEQIYPLGIQPVSVFMHVCSPKLFEKGKICVLLIKGRPSCIKGLDEGMIRSASMPCDTGAIYVMTERAYKKFVSEITI